MNDPLPVPGWELVSLPWLSEYRKYTQVWGQSKIIKNNINFWNPSTTVIRIHPELGRSTLDCYSVCVSKSTRPAWLHGSNLMLFSDFIMSNGCCLTSTPDFIVWTMKMKMKPARLVDRTWCLRDPIPVSAIKWKLPFTYSSGLINYTLSCAFIKAQWNMGSKLHCVPVSCYVKAV